MLTMWQTIEYLKEPALVAKVQQYFGVKTVKRTENNSMSRKSYSVRANSKAINNESTKCTKDYEIQNTFWYYLFVVGTALADEIFYASFIPFWFWNIDGAVGRRVVCVWTITMYIGQGMKDIVKWPRPTYPAKRLQTKWAEEHGMPSTHAMVAVSIPLSVILYTMNRYIYSVPLGAFFALCWCTLICTSRIYLGMHSVLDIVAGLALALILMIPMVPLVDAMDIVWMKEMWSPLVIMSIAILIIIYFPHSDHWTPTWGDTVMIISVCAGILIGSWINYQIGNMLPFPHPPPYSIIWPDSRMLALGGLRTLLGFALVFFTRSSIKRVMKAILLPLTNVDLNNRKQSDPLMRRRTIFVELSVKFVTYFTIGINIVFSIPVLFRFLGIERPTFYTEI